jgi:hypothetical protein
MDYELFWVNEMVTDNDEAIILLEAELMEGKAFLARLSEGDDLF